MLIKCPECNKEISNLAPACIHCGYPLQNLDNNIQTNDLYEIKLIGYQKGKSGSVASALIEAIGPEYDFWDIIDNLKIIKSNITLEEANRIKTIVEKKCGKVSITKVSDNTVAYDTEEHRKSINVPYCPKCSSTHIEATQRGYSGFWGFLGSGITMNYCKNCGHKWNP